MDLVATFAVVLHSPWLLLLLAAMIAVDGPFPVLPSEVLLMSASAAAFGTGDVLGVAGLFLAAVIGSLLGDQVVYWLGRTSSRFLHRRITREGPLTGWVRRTMFRAPVVALVGARFVPGGRLVSAAAAGLVELPLRRFVGGSAASGALWACYMLIVGLALGPITGGNPLLCLAAGVAMAVLTAAIFAVVHRLRPATP